MRGPFGSWISADAGSMLSISARSFRHAHELEQRLADERAGHAEHAARGIVEQLLDAMRAVERDHALLREALRDRREQHALTGEVAR